MNSKTLLWKYLGSIGDPDRAAGLLPPSFRYALTAPATTRTR